MFHFFPTRTKLPRFILPMPLNNGQMVVEKSEVAPKAMDAFIETVRRVSFMPHRWPPAEYLKQEAHALFPRGTDIDSFIAWLEKRELPHAYDDPCDQYGVIKNGWHIEQ